MDAAFALVVRGPDYDRESRAGSREKYPGRRPDCSKTILTFSDLSL